MLSPFLVFAVPLCVSFSVKLNIQYYRQKHLKKERKVKQNDYKNVLCDIRVLFFVVTVEQIIRWTNEGKERASLFVVL